MSRCLSNLITVNSNLSSKVNLLFKTNFSQCSLYCLGNRMVELWCCVNNEEQQLYQWQWFRMFSNFCWDGQAIGSAISTTTATGCCHHSCRFVLHDRLIIPIHDSCPLGPSSFTCSFKSFDPFTHAFHSWGHYNRGLPCLGPRAIFAETIYYQQLKINRYIQQQLGDGN